MTDPAPTPEEIDQLAKEYLDTKEMYFNATLAAKDLQQQMEMRGERLKEAVALFGQQHKEKSKLIHGLKFEAMCTYAQSTVVDAVAVERFRHELVMSKQTRLMNKLFQKDIRYTLKIGVSAVIRSEKLAAKFRNLWARCIVIKDIAPKLTVREKEKAA